MFQLINIYTGIYMYFNIYFGNLRGKHKCVFKACNIEGDYYNTKVIFCP